jgi:hypothetical protein
VAPGVIVAWPTKLSMAPVLADEVLQLIQLNVRSPGGYDELPSWPAPGVAPYPWEDAEWFAVN